MENKVENPLFSIIVPHKNSAALLARLIESIPHDFPCEVLVVDDNSSASTIEELRGLRFPSTVRLIMIGEPGGNAGRARNLGLRHARSPWIVFADADDVFTEAMPSALLSAASDTAADIVYFDVTSRNEVGETSYRHYTYSNLVRNAVDASGVEELRYRHTPPWAKMFSRAFLKRIDARFDEVPASNDIYFSIFCAHNAALVRTCSDIVYVVSQRSGSITNTISTTNLLSKFESALKVNSFLKSEGKSKFQHSIIYFLYRTFTRNPYLGMVLLYRSVRAGNNPLIGARKLLSPIRTLQQRESR